MVALAVGDSSGVALGVALIVPPGFALDVEVGCLVGVTGADALGDAPTDRSGVEDADIVACTCAVTDGVPDVVDVACGVFDATVLLVVFLMDDGGVEACHQSSLVGSVLAIGVADTFAKLDVSHLQREFASVASALVLGSSGDFLYTIVGNLTKEKRHSISQELTYQLA
jgi:hypothetical protein